MLACTWHDTKRVSFLSVAKDIRKQRGDGGFRHVKKPIVAEDYNTYTGGVDLLDQLLGTYCYPHKGSKWYLAVYFSIFSILYYHCSLLGELEAWIPVPTSSHSAALLLFLHFHKCVLPVCFLDP